MELFARQTSLSGQIVRLCRYLRTKGYSISSSEESDVMKSLSEILPYSEERYTLVLKAILCKNKYQYEHFETHYKDFKYELEKAVNSKVKDANHEAQKPTQLKTPSIEDLKDWLYNRSDKDESSKSSYSDVEVFTKKDFAHMSPDELKLITNVLKRIVQKILRKKSRLQIKSKNRKQIDLKKTIRYNLRSGLDINQVVYTERKLKRLKLVLLCDVSRSMDIYNRFCIQMIYAFQQSYDRINTFVFSTALHDVTDILSNHESDAAFQLISDRVPQWSGGTKIGSCFTTFTEEHGYNLLDRKTVVMIMSDGWDTGDPTDITTAMKFIHKASRKVLWLNPLAGHPDFIPEVIGLKSVLSYIDRLVPAHNLQSLKEALFLA